MDKVEFEGLVHIAFDEWNLRGWHHPRSGGFRADVAARDRNDVDARYTMPDAVFSAGFLNSCIRHCDTVRMANMAPVINARGPLYVHPEGIVRRTTFHVLAMYSNLLADCAASARVTGDVFAVGDSSVPLLDALATCDDTMQRWRLALVNRHPDQQATCTITVDRRPLEGPHKATVLSGDSPDDYNDAEHPSRCFPLRKSWCSKMVQ